MKKLIFLLLALISLAGYSQRVYTSTTKTITADVTWSSKFYTTAPWSLQFNFSEFDQADATLTLYSCGDPDSLLYDILWVDQNLNGVNDNPWTLADSSLTVWGESFPFRYMVFKLTHGTITHGKKLYYWTTK